MRGDKIDTIWEVILGVLLSIGGISGIMIIAIKLSINFIVKRMEQRYSLEIDKKLEHYKYDLDNKTYISKVRFDTEFSIYKELSKKFSEMVRDISAVIPYGCSKYPSDEKEKKIYEERLYFKALDAKTNAQDSLDGSIPFISEDLYMKYNEIIKLCQMQLGVFERRWDDGILSSQKEKEYFSHEDHKRTKIINLDFKALNNDIRDYLSKLEVLN